MQGILLVLGWMLLSLGAVSPLLARAQSDADDAASYHGFYLLPFDRYGDLTSIYERDLAIEELRRNRKVRRIFVISYGWANDGEASHAAYLELLASLRRNLPTDPRPDEVAIFGVGWDSGQSGVRKLLNDVLPLPLVADGLARVPDAALFPLSFWSKAAMGDRIGYGGLRRTLNEILNAVYAGADEGAVPEIFLIGHSFGARVVSALMQDQVGWLRVRAEPFAWAHRVRGAVLFQPAMVAENLHESAEYPILVTFSRHDHANGLLFPLANLAINAYAFSATEALIQRGVLDPLAAAGAELVDSTERLSRRAPEAGPKDADTAADPGARRTDSMRELPSGAFRATRRLTLELVTIPASLTVAVVATPAGYLYTQASGIATRPVGHLMDSLAEVPVVGAVVDGVSRLAGRAVPWGSDSKGIFELGGINESVGRLSTARIRTGGRLPVYRAGELLDGTRFATECGLPRCHGVIMVDASEFVTRGQFGELEDSLVGAWFGWLDPIGAHSDYANPDVVRLGARILETSPRSERALPDPAVPAAPRARAPARCDDSSLSSRVRRNAPPPGACPPVARPGS